MPPSIRSLVLCSALTACGPLDPSFAHSELPLDNAPPDPTCRSISDPAELARVLINDEYRGVICIPNSATLNLTGEHNLPLRDGVTLLSGRHATTEGALLYTTDLVGTVDEAGGHHSYALFDIRGNNVRIDGLRLRGPSGSFNRDNLGVHGIRVRTGSANRNVIIQHNELMNWTGAAVTVVGEVSDEAWNYPRDVPSDIFHMTPDQASQVQIARNYIHHNVRDGLGYGVQVGSGAYAAIWGNLFDYNRHAVASDGQPFSGYLAYYNYVLEGGHCEDPGIAPCYYNQHFDVHGTGDGGYKGTAGEYYSIRQNTIRGEQSYYAGFATRPALKVRASPSMGIYFDSNVLVHDDEGEAVSLDDGDLIASAFVNVHIGPNRYDLDTSLDIGVGDFDGDRKDDVFLATGTAWFYSSAGQAEWRELSGRKQRMSEIALGRFDDDSRTDVFVKSGDGWYYSSGGTGPFVQIGSSAVPFSEYRFGDFNGDGKTDIFRANGTHWYISWSGRSGWDEVATSAYRVADLRFGDFDGDGATDVFGIANGQWSWSRSAQSGWQKLNDLLSSDLNSLQFGDFDGDHRTDIAQRSGSIWRFSQYGRTLWRQLRGTTENTWDVPTFALVGDFNGDGTDDLLRYDFGAPLAFPFGRQLVMWSRPLGDAFQVRSRHDMR